MIERSSPSPEFGAFLEASFKASPTCVCQADNDYQGLRLIQQVTVARCGRKNFQFDVRTHEVHQVMVQLGLTE